MAFCNGETKNGKPCGANAGPSGKCAMHARKNRAREMARKSVTARQKAKAEALDRLTTEAPKSPEDLVRELSIAFAELKNGKMGENMARALATLSNSILKGFELVDVKKQLDSIERLLKERA